VSVGRREAREEAASVLLDAFLGAVPFHRVGDFLDLGIRYEVGGVALVERGDRPEDAKGFDLDDDVGGVGGHDHHHELRPSFVAESFFGRVEGVHGR